MAESDASSVSSVTEMTINITQTEPRGAFTNSTSLIKMSDTYGQEKGEIYCEERGANLSIAQRRCS